MCPPKMSVDTILLTRTYSSKMTSPAGYEARRDVQDFVFGERTLRDGRLIHGFVERQSAGLVDDEDIDRPQGFDCSPATTRVVGSHTRGDLARPIAGYETLVS